MLNEKRKRIPQVILNLFIDYEAWFTGSGLNWYLNEKASDPRPKDFDIIIPYKNWNKAVRSFEAHPFFLNSFGGLKISLSDDEGSLTLDIWPQNLEEYLTNCPIGTKCLRLFPHTLIEKK